MISFFALSSAVATSVAGQGATMPAGNMTKSMIEIIAIFFIFYLFFIRPQQKRAKEHLDMLAQLKVGDEVVASGFVGKVKALVNEAEVMIEFNKNVEVKVLRSAISQVLIEKEVKGKE